jgi:hypothetical protein
MQYAPLRALLSGILTLSPCHLVTPSSRHPVTGLSFAAEINPRSFPVGRTSLREIAKKVGGGRLLGLGLAPPVAESPEEIRAGIKR